MQRTFISTDGLSTITLIEGNLKTTNDELDAPYMGFVLFGIFIFFIFLCFSFVGMTQIRRDRGK